MYMNIHQDRVYAELWNKVKTIEVIQSMFSDHIEIKI